MKKYSKTDFLQIEVNFEVYTKKTVKTILPRDMSIYEFEQILIHKMNLPKNEKKDIEIIRINDRIIDSYKKQLQKMSEIKEKSMILKVNLDQIITNLIELDYSDYEFLEKNNELDYSLNDFLNENEISEYNQSAFPNNNLKISNEITTRGVTVLSENYEYNNNKYVLTSFNHNEFKKMGFNPKNLMSFSHLSHKKFIRPVGRTIDIELSEIKGEIQYKNIMLDVKCLWQNTLERMIMNDDVSDTNKWLMLYNICDIIDYFHDNNVIHGNLTPFNVIVQNFDNIHLIDYGISCYWKFEDEIDQDKNLMLQRNYLYGPPEFFPSQMTIFNHFKTYSDIWSLGCLIYFIFTRKHPWIGHNCTNDLIDYKSYIDMNFKNNEIFHIIDENEIDHNALFLIQKCCSYDIDKRMPIKQIKMFIVLQASKICPELILNLVKEYKIDDISNQEMQTNISTTYTDNTYLKKHISSTAEIFSNKVFKELLDNSENFDVDLKLDFSSLGMGNEKINFLGSFFSYLNKIRSIDLRSNMINFEGFEGIISFYKNFRTKLQYFFLDKNQIDQNCFYRLSEVMYPNNIYIKNLSLVGCSTKKNDIIPLLNILNKFNQLDTLNLSENFISDFEFNLICSNFIYLKNLTSLILKDNLITGKSMSSLVENTKNLNNLKFFSLDLSYNKLNSEGFLEFSKIFMNVNQIHTIILEGNNAGDEGISYMFETMIDHSIKLMKSCRIERLNIEKNEFTDVGGKKILNFYSILKNKKIKNFIINLEFEYNNISKKVENKIRDFSNSIQNQLYKIFQREVQNDIESYIKSLNESLIKKCPTISVSDFKLDEITQIRNNQKVRRIFLFNLYKNTEINITLYDELFLAEKFFYSLSMSKENKSEISIDFYPHAKKGDKFLPLERLIKDDKKSEFIKLEHISGVITIMLFFVYNPNSISLLKDLNDLLVLKMNKYKNKIIVKAVMYGVIDQLERFENKSNYINFEFYLLDSSAPEAFTYGKYFYNIDLTETQVDLLENIPYLVINKFGTIAYIKDKLVIETLDNCLEFITLNDYEMFSNKIKNNQTHISQKSFELYDIDHTVMKKVRSIISYFQKVLLANTSHYNYIFQYIESKEIMIGHGLNVVGYKTASLKLEIFARHNEYTSILKFLNTKINPMIPLEIFKIKKQIMKTVDFKLGENCKNCNCGKQTVFSYFGQYYCYSCDKYFCEKCGDLFDDSKKGLAKLIHPHNLVYLLNYPSNNEVNFMNEIDLHRIGNVRIVEEAKHAENIDDLFKMPQNVICDFCEKYFDQNFRFICLNCDPGVTEETGFVDFCPTCINFFRDSNRKEINPVALENYQDECYKISGKLEKHIIGGHIYLKVIASFGGYSKY